MSSSAWQIRTAPPTSYRSSDALKNLHLNNNISKPDLSSLPPNTVLVNIRAAAINARDMMVIAHDPSYPGTNIPDLTPCLDGAGTIAGAGAGSVWAGKTGLPILLHSTSWITGLVPKMFDLAGKGAGPEQGTLRQYGIFPDSHVIPAPSHLSFEELAALPCAGGTAVNALFFGPAKLERGMVVLTQGTGGVSCFAIQLAAAVGATVISTSSSDAKLAIAKKLGATHTINYATNPKWEEEVLHLTDGKGVDIVVEVGGSGTIEQSLACTKQGGLVSLVGLLSGSKKSDLIPALLFGGKTVFGVFGIRKDHTVELARLFEEYKLHPVVGEVFEWEDAVAAFKKSMDREVVGKIVIKVA